MKASFKGDTLVIEIKDIGEILSFSILDSIYSIAINQSKKRLNEEQNPTYIKLIKKYNKKTITNLFDYLNSRIITNNLRKVICNKYNIKSENDFIDKINELVLAEKL